MSFNIRSGPSLTHPWSARRDQVIETVREYNPQLIGFQEANRRALAALADSLPHLAVCGGSPRRFGRGQRVPILYDARLIKFRSQRTFGLGPKRYKPNWDARFVRIATLIEFEDFCVVNTHLDHRGAESRVRGAELICATVKPPAIVMGDFNDLPGSPALEIFGRNGFRDSFPDPGAPTYHAFDGIGRIGKIDYILCDSSWDVTDAAILSRDRSSDHFPVTARLSSS